MLKEIKKFLGFKEEKTNPPDVYAIIKLNDIAKESGIYDNQNRIIEIHKYGRVDRIKFSEADVEALREQGIPVIDEEYTDEHEWIEINSGHIENKL